MADRVGISTLKPKGEWAENLKLVTEIGGTYKYGGKDQPMKEPAVFRLFDDPVAPVTAITLLVVIGLLVFGSQ